MLSNALVIVGVLTIFLGYILFLVAAFGESFLWGILCFFFWPVHLLFLVTHWYNVRSAFILQLAGTAMVFLGVVMAPASVR
jgi:hypothetical protein